MTLSFRRMAARNWRQFRQVDLEFHPRLTVLTGANGSGKTSLLQLLSPHFSWEAQFAGNSETEPADHAHQSPAQLRTLGPGASVILEYTDGVKSSLMVPKGSAAAWDARWTNMQRVRGIYIPSHRTAPGLNPVERLPTSFDSAEALLETYLKEVRQWTAGPNTYRKVEKPALHMKSALMSSAIFSESTSAIRADPTAHEVWNGFRDVLARLLPAELGFERLEVRSPELFMITRGGDFPVDAASGGISAILEYAWQIFLEARGVDKFIVCFDEPENHLHPQLQRSLLPRLMEAFPGAQFIVASHSPFVVTSVPDSNLYALAYNENRVEGQLLDRANKAQAAEQTLRDVLGLESTLPMWAEAELQSILEQFASSKQTIESLHELRNRLSNSGLAAEFPATVAALARKARIDKSY